MKLKILTLLLLSLLSIDCQIGTREDACKSDLKRDYSASFCEILNIAPLARSSDGTNTDGINNLIIGCLLYHVKVKECEKEGNQYVPALYSKE
ncbi:hypothetical protein LFX25_20470 [Leptospira sp. FAT2]|uniref:hypothetical protein n=1 Tax=Leptospira sanjuanensis TaxID=2879643 RepID=UPI001EE8B355|nr:hypothetical protein [Leptospira sanjuanensis]MCG6195621.1 hypothetical protein [Leptospira sanjuanensis]